MRKIVEKSLLGQAWIGAEYSDGNVSRFSADGLIARVLDIRGISGDDARRFLNPTLKECMPDPSVLRDMDRGARVIADSIVAGDKIAIYGDYDVDGITSTAIFIKYLRVLGVDAVWHLPTREGEGYGLNTAAVEELAADGVNLLVTVDCGISGATKVARAHELGMRVVVTDHHSPEGGIPDADAVINPKRNDDTSGLQYLAGVGVAFMTLVALHRELKSRQLSDEMRRALDGIDLRNYMDLVALGTVCDTMPLVDLNRAFVVIGLKVLGMRGNLGLSLLMDVAKIPSPSVFALGFGLGPRLNAAGRLDSAAPSLELLLTDNKLIAVDLANKLNEMNRARIDIQNAIMLDATARADKCRDEGRYSIFVCGDNWHGGVMGIIAGRLKDKYNLPTCVATRMDGAINGSGRSIPGVDLGHIIHEALSAGILSEGGGHAAAAGFSLPVENEDAFRNFLETEVSKQLDGTIPMREVFVDAELDAGAATMDLVKKLSVLEPYGQGNPEPRLMLTGAILGNERPRCKGAHISGTVMTSGEKLRFIAFNMADTPAGDFLLDAANANTKILMLGKLKENNYNDRTSVQFVLEDIALGGNREI